MVIHDFHYQDKLSATEKNTKGNIYLQTLLKGECTLPFVSNHVNKGILCI